MCALLFFQQSDEPYVMDEADFAGVVGAVADTGRPVYYRGEDLPFNVGIWHPPLYQYTAAGWQQIFGTSHTALRSYGFACVLASVLIGWLLLRRLFPRRPWLFVAWLGIFVLHPFVVQSALLPDIDSTVLVPLSLALCLGIIEAVIYRRRLMLLIAYFGFVLGLAFLAKLTTPIAFIPLVVVALAFATRSWRATIVGTAGSLGVAVAIFVTVWGSVAKLAHVEFTYPFTFTRASTGKRDLTVSERLYALWPSEIVIYWLTPLMLILTAIGVLAALRFWRTSTGQSLILLGIYVGLVVFTYNAITGPPFGFPKYYAPAVGPAVVLAVAPLAVLPRMRLSSRARSGPAALFAVLAGTVLICVCVLVYARRARFSTFPDLPWWLLLALVVTVCGGLWFATRPVRDWRDGAALIMASALIIVVVMNVGLAFQQRSAAGSTRYYPGERDLAETIEKVETLLDSSRALDRAQLLSAKDIGYGAGVRYFEDAAYLPDVERLSSLIRGRPDLVIVTRSTYDYSQIVWPEAFVRIRQLARPIWVSPHGFFTIWRVGRGER